MVRLMVQGDREARGIEKHVRRLGELCKERGVGLNVGEAGRIINILTSTGADIWVHQSKPARTETLSRHDSVRVVDCFCPAETAVQKLETPGAKSRLHLEWGVRLMHMICMSDGFIFFPGAEGTLAHLIPVMASIAKGERDKNKEPRRIALIGWEMTRVHAILRAMGYRREDKDMHEEWFKSFFSINKETIAGALDFVTKADV